MTNITEVLFVYQESIRKTAPREKKELKMKQRKFKMKIDWFGILNAVLAAGLWGYVFYLFIQEI